MCMCVFGKMSEVPEMCQRERNGNERDCHAALKTLKGARLCLQLENRPKTSLRDNKRNFLTNPEREFCEVYSAQQATGNC